ncbi:hypothetical protein NB693_20740 [Pantoea ananatis]|uniref:hypothetical protein n=1 Tax=Pantoea ananas TaxID=553 RepID=UPI002220EC2A|nr:hypothetical protein [Pantoea ananatis]
MKRTLGLPWSPLAGCQPTCWMAAPTPFAYAVESAVADVAGAVAIQVSAPVVVGEGGVLHVDGVNTAGAVGGDVVADHGAAYRQRAAAADAPLEIAGQRRGREVEASARAVVNDHAR